MTEIPGGRSGISLPSMRLADLILYVCLAVFAAPTIYRLGTQVWSTEFGAHGPIVLGTGAWLLWRRRGALTQDRCEANPWLIGLVALISLPLYVFGRAYDLLSIEALGLYWFFLNCLYSRFGAPALLRQWFPLVYLALLLPLPGWALDQLTAPLKLMVSTTSSGIVQLMGLPVVQEGVSLTVGPYQLLVEDACAGLNSLIGLISVGLFYVAVLRAATVRYSVTLLLFILPIAVLANVIRIVCLILLTYFFGDAVGQGFLHVTAGMFLFALSLGLMFLVDALLARLPAFQTAAATS